MCVCVRACVRACVRVCNCVTVRVTLCRNYMADTGADAADMRAQVAAYRNTMTALVKKVVPMGGYWWQLMDGGMCVCVCVCVCVASV